MNETRIATLYRGHNLSDADEAALEAARQDEDYVPRCDYCGRRFDDSPSPFADADWNGETGNHETCEQMELSR